MLILCFRWSVCSAVSGRWKVVSSTSSTHPFFLWKNKWRTSRCCLCWLWEHWNYAIHKVSTTHSLFFIAYLAEISVEFFIGCLTSLVEQAVYAATHNPCHSREDILHHTLTWCFPAGLCGLLKVWNFDSSLCHVLEFFWFDPSDTNCLSLIMDVDCLLAKRKLDPGVDLRIFCVW